MSEGAGRKPIPPPREIANTFERVHSVPFLLTAIHQHNAEPLENRLLRNDLQCAERQEAAWMDSGKWKGWIGTGIGGLLIVAGVIGLIWRSIAEHFEWVCCPSDVLVELWKAMFVAGVVTIAVDPFLKRRLLKEASTDIFHHLLGFDLPLDIRETLRDFLFKNRSYRRNVIIDVRAETAFDGMVDIT
jgi:hypothetical protein